jgi:hypothetical protein
MRFWRPFLVQFFLNPFQFFIVVPWAFALFSLIKGYMPLKRGGKIERAADPVNFWISVGFCAGIGTIMFIANLVLSWLVVSRPR